MKKISLPEGERLISAFSFLSGFLIGVLWVCIYRESWMLSMSLLNLDFLWKIEQMTVDKRALLFLTMGKRLRAFFVLWLMGLTPVRRLAAPVFFFLCGISTGTVMEMLALQYGMKGLLLYLGMILPQAFFHVPGFYLLGKLCTESGEENKRKKVYIILALVIVTAGIFVESYVNPGLLRVVVKLFSG